jgi:DNA-binding NtrC family response regulator
MSSLPKANSAAPAIPAKLQHAGAPILEQVTKAKEEAEIEVILGVLTSSRWNRKQAAKLLGMDYKALLYKMKKLGLDEKGLDVQSEVAPGRAIGARVG